MNHEQNISFMKLAIEQARAAAAIGEVPVGAVVCRNGELISTGYNRRETGKSALAHAEITAISSACEKLGGWRLHECDLYVTLEPCPMCAGAIINARIKTLFFGAYDPKAGCFGSITDFRDIAFNHHPAVSGGLMEGECAALLTDFFRMLRVNGKA